MAMIFMACLAPRGGWLGFRSRVPFYTYLEARLVGLSVLAVRGYR